MSGKESCIKYASLEEASKELLTWKIYRERREPPKSPIGIIERITYLEDNGYILERRGQTPKVAAFFGYKVTEKGYAWVKN
ncbi:MAG: hypothetical protein WC812_01705 [Candidatus Pacearchaeota archaeon]|jgi:hypothetical protein